MCGVRVRILTFTRFEVANRAIHKMQIWKLSRTASEIRVPIGIVNAHKS
jgi:hypothetical protein